MNYLFLFLTAILYLSCGKDDSNKIAKIPEASGIDYCRSSDTLVVANDEGSYYEIDLDGDIIRKIKLGKYDLEGVVCTDDLLIFAIEDEALLFVDRKSGKSNKVAPDTTYRNKNLQLFGKKHGIEGIAKSGDTIYLAKQASKKRESFIVVIEPTKDLYKIIDLIESIPATSGLTTNKGYLYILSDKKDLLIRYDLQKKRILYSVKLPKTAQEGIAFDGKGFVYIADDDGYVLKYSEKDLGL